jgi:hypothetical protein
LLAFRKVSINLDLLPQQPPGATRGKKEDILPETPVDDLLNYNNMLKVSVTSARTDTGCRSVVAIFGIVSCCLGSYMGYLVLQRGWDWLFRMLGWK